MKRKNIRLSINQLQPSQAYLSKPKIEAVSSSFYLLSRPVPVYRKNGQFFLVGGHSRCFVLNAMGYNEIDAYLIDEPLDWEGYEICVKKCQKEGICSIADLEDRIVSGSDFRNLWAEQCQKIHSKGKCLRKRDCHNCHLLEEDSRFLHN